MHPYTSFKNEQKKIAAQIRDLKNFVNETMAAGSYAGSQQYNLLKLQQEYRARHVAYCEARGRTREQIEPKSRPLTPWIQNTLEKQILTYKTELLAQVAQADWDFEHPEGSCQAVSA